MNDPMLLDPVDLFTAQVVAASGSITSARLPVGKLSKIHVLVKNTGASENVTITIEEATAPTGGMVGVIIPFTLGATEGASMYIAPGAVPKFIYAVITNSDTVNAATITVTLDRWR